MAQETLLDLYGHPKGPLNGPCEADFRRPLVKKGPPGSHQSPKWYFFKNISIDNWQTRIYSFVWGKSDFLFQRNNYFTFWWANLPPPAWLGLTYQTTFFASILILVGSQEVLGCSFLKVPAFEGPKMGQPPPPQRKKNQAFWKKSNTFLPLLSTQFRALSDFLRCLFSLVLTITTHPPKPIPSHSGKVEMQLEIHHTGKVNNW